MSQKFGQKYLFGGQSNDGIRLVNRRAALSYLSAGICSATIGGPESHLSAAPASGPLLATPDQIDAERALLRLLEDPEVKKIQTERKADLAATPRGQTKDGGARLDEAIAQWTNSFIFGAIANTTSPALLWATDDTPRTWLGHTIGGVGTSGDNPDAIYRIAALDGDGRYEILGRFDKDKPGAQLIVESHKADLTNPGGLFERNKQSTDVSSQAGGLTDRDLVTGPDGAFRISVGGSPDGPNHLPMAPGQMTLGIRDMLSDWNQRPCRLSIRRLDTTATPKPDLERLTRLVHERLAGYIRFWAGFPDIWMGGLKPNSVKEPSGRNGGWGFVSGLRYALEPGEAILVTTMRGEARYTGFQVIDPWMIAPDARKYHASINLSQAVANEDGSFTYVIAPSDPGVANWLDTTGLHEGFGIIRWQNVPPDATGDGLLRDFRVVALTDIANMPGLARVTPKERKARLAARAESYTSRLR